MKLPRFLQRFFDRYELAWETFMMVLALSFVLLYFLPDFISFSAATLETMAQIDLGITTFFVFEFVTRLLIAPSRKVYFKEHWIDMVALFPAIRWLRFVRIARLIRLLRLLRLVRALDTLNVVMNRLKVEFSRYVRFNGLQWMLVALASIMLFASSLLFYFEKGVNDKIGNYWDALYAGLVTWTTPGYGDIAPITTGGRICGIVLIISGLFAWGLLIANLASYLTTRRVGRSDIAPAILELEQKLDCVNDLSEVELVTLRGAVTALIEDRIEAIKADEEATPY